MDKKFISLGSSPRKKVLNGISKTVEAIKQTMGPCGKAIAIDTGYEPDISRDGATVAKAITLEDPEENIGSSLVKMAASLTETKAGDGTSTTSTLIDRICKKGQYYIDKGENVNEIREGLMKAKEEVISIIKGMTSKVDGDLDKIERVATIAANNDQEIGKLVRRAVELVGTDSLITAETSSSLETKIEVTQGMKLDRGWVSPEFVTEPKEGKCILENPLILVAGERLSNLQQVVGLLKDLESKGLTSRPLLIICDEIEESVLRMFTFNSSMGSLKTCIVKGIDFGDNRKNVMEDISVFVGASHICPENQTEVAKASSVDLGTAEKVVVTRDSCIIFKGKGDPEIIKERIEILQSHLKNPEISSYDRTKFEKRVSNLSGGIAIIRSGGATDVEKLNRKATIEDSILAAKCAVEEGYCPGGGIAYLQASDILSEPKDPRHKVGYEILKSSLSVIFETLIYNRGQHSVGEVKLLMKDAISKDEKNRRFIGYNAKTGEVSNLLEDGILDSTKVLRVSLDNAVSAASMALSIGGDIIKVADKVKNSDEHSCDDDSCGCVNSRTGYDLGLK